MSEQHDPFFPQHVDEAIEQLAGSDHSSDTAQQPLHLDPNTHLIHDLQRLYRPERERYQQALQRVEGRLLEQWSAQNERHAASFTPFSKGSQPFKQRKIQQGNVHSMEIKQPSSVAKFGRLLGLLVAALVLVGSLIVVLNYAHPRTSAGGSATGSSAPPTQSRPSPTPTTGTPPGTTLYTTPANPVGFNGLSWSPDSRRVASATVNGVQIWDATTGKHQISVQLPGANEWPYGLDWSPTSQLVAVATNQHVLIVNGQTGKVVRPYGASATAVTSPVSVGKTYFTSQFPASGGLGFRATAWSPDGHMIASALSYGPYGDVQVWNPQNGTLAYTLKLNNTSYGIGTVSWSADGQYIAASAWNTQGGAPTQPDSMVVVWKVSTHQLVFQHSDYMNSDALVLWQPRSHNLAFAGATHAGNNLIPTLEIWNATTGKLVKQYAGGGSDALAWSPDGTALASTAYMRKSGVYSVVIIDVLTGKQLFVYKGHHVNVSIMAWSPNGKYIVSGEGNASGSTVAKVWTAA